MGMSTPGVGIPSPFVSIRAGKLGPRQRFGGLQGLICPDRGAAHNAAARRAGARTRLPLFMSHSPFATSKGTSRECSLRRFDESTKVTELCSKGTRARKLVVTAVLVLAGGALAVSYALGRLPRLSKATIWTIGICSGNSPFSPKPLEGACNPVLSVNDVTDAPARYVADPFLLRREGRWWLFFEVLDGRTGRGEIGLAESPDARRWTYRGIILREPFHLSYPCVFEWQVVVYLVPEAAATGSIRLYRASPFPDRWVWTRNILSGRPFTDSTIFRHHDRWWLFTTTDPRGNGSLSLYSSKDLEGAWAEHPKSPVVSGNPHGARPAGRVLSIGGRLFRFAQEDSPRYGL